MTKTLEKIGDVVHYYTNISVAVIELTAPIKVGEEITIRGTTTSFDQQVKSMQVEHEQVQEAKAGDAIGLKVTDRARKGDIVYKYVEV
jgi:putative protease